MFHLKKWSCSHGENFLGTRFPDTYLENFLDMRNLLRWIKRERIQSGSDIFAVLRFVCVSKEGYPRTYNAQKSAKKTKNLKNEEVSI